MEGANKYLVGFCAAVLIAGLIAFVISLYDLFTQ